MARVLVTGGAGFIGSNLCLGLEAKGHEVVAVDRTRRSTLAEFQGRFVEWDVTRPLEVEGRFDAVFHHGDITDPRFPDDEEVLRRNLSGFTNLVDFAQARGAKLVYASTAGLYGNGPTPMRESQDKEILTAYGRSKWEMDQRAEQLKDRLPIVGLRYFNVYGPREEHKERAASMILHLSRQMREGKRPRLFRHGEQKRDFIYVKDVVEANIRAWEGPSGVYNVGTGVGSTFNELVACLNRSLGTDLEPEYFDMPYDPATYQANTQADPEKAARELGFTARWTLQEGIDDYLSWLGYR